MIELVDFFALFPSFRLHGLRRDKLREVISLLKVIEFFDHDHDHDHDHDQDLAFGAIAPLCPLSVLCGELF